MKKFTFILTSMLFFLVGGVKADPTPLLILGGQNWKAVSLYDTSLQTYQREYGSYSSYDSNKGESFYQTAIVKFEGSSEWGNCNLGQGQWKAAFVSGQQHRFVITFTSAEYNGTNYNGPSMDLQLVAIKNNSIIKTADISEGASSGEITITEDYDEVVLIKTKSWNNDAYIPIASITREISTASSVAAPTISPASSTYDGDLSVTIAKGANNTKVVYSVTGSNEDVSNVEFTSAELTAGSKTLTLTGAGDITVTATGYNGGDASSVVENTYTYNIPSGQSSTTSGLPYTFDSWGKSITFNNSFFSNIKEGDYVVFNVQDVKKDGTVLGFRKGWDEPPYRECTTTSRGNGAKGILNIGDTQWWMKVNSDVVSALKNNEVRMQGGMVTDGPNDDNPDDDISSSVILNSLNVYECKALNESSDNSTALSSKINHVVVELTRSFVAGTWNTVCLPFSLTSDQATQLFGSGYKLAQFTSVSGTTMRFTTAGTFEAGVPYLVKPTIDVNTANPVVLVDVNITAKTAQKVTHKSDNGEYYSFVGNFTQKTFNGDNECNTSRFVATGNELKKPIDNTTLNSLRCYFTVSATAPARSLTFDIDEEGGTTSINTVQGSGVMVNGYYNLAGQRVAQPTKGLYIVNGKKVVIK